MTSIPRDKAFLHGVTCRPGPPQGLLARPALTEDGSTSWVPIAYRVSGAQDVLDQAGQGLSEGPARAEALAARLACLGVPLSWAEPDIVSDAKALSEVARARGVSSLGLIRGDPSLVLDLQIGAWFDAPWLPRLVRRAPASDAVFGLLRGNPLALALDRAFWRGVRSEATAAEWDRLTRSSYVALLYHRIAPEAPTEEERLHVPPAAFDRQLRLLNALRFRPLAPEELFRFHEQSSTALSRRSYVVTADDGFLDAAQAFRRHRLQRPQLFVATRLVEQGRVDWSAAPLASWNELRAAVDEGVAIGSHTRRHWSLSDSSAERLVDELVGSLADLRERLGDVLPIVAYPHGHHDGSTRTAAASAGYRAAYTTAPGRNSAGMDPYALRRISVKSWDGRLSFLWKVLTGQPLPSWWERRRRRVYRTRQRLRSGSDSTSS
jgi:peptidoglycan/xylan/chitin deacetylase (PgdA/CDA1 family)